MAHVALCAACASNLEDIRENNALIQRIRASLTHDDPAVIPSDLVPGYTILEEIHRGGQGIVYKALENDTRRIVAIKILLSSELVHSRRKQRFESELSVAANLRHPNIVVVYNSVRPRDGRAGFAMEYISGRPMSQWVRAGQSGAPPSLREKVALFIKVCDAVQFAHRHGVIHRDLKPGNVLVDADDEPHLCDFGVAKTLVSRGLPTMTDEFVGTLAYASPEQVRGSPDGVDTRSDVYSLGVMLYEMLVGAMPYDVDRPLSEVVRNIESTEALRPSKLGVRLGADLETILLTALAKDPERRYQLAQLLRDDLRRYLSGDAIDARRSSGWYVLRKTTRRYWPVVAVASAFVALVTGFGVWSRVQAVQLRHLLSESRHESALLLLESGSPAAAEPILWRELLADPAGEERWLPGDPRLPTSRSWWALWSHYAANPCLRTVRVGSSTVSILAPRPDGESFFWADRNGSVGIRRVRDLAPIVEARPQSNAPLIRLAAWRADGSIAILRADGAVERLDPLTLEPTEPRFTLHAGSEWAASLSADGTRLAIETPDGVRIVDVSDGREMWRFAHAFEPRTLRVSFSADGEWILTRDRREWTLRRIGDVVTPPRVHAETFVHLVQLCAVAGSEPRWMYAEGGRLHEFDGATMTSRRIGLIDRVSRSMAASTSADGAMCAVAAEDLRVSVWRMHGQPDDEPLAYYSGHDASCTSTLVAPALGLVISGDEAGAIKQWELPKLGRHREPRLIRGHRDSVFAVAVAPDHPYMYTASADEHVRMWNARTGALIASVPVGGSVEAVTISPDGRLVAAAVKMTRSPGVVSGDIVLLRGGTLDVVARIHSAHETKRCCDVAIAPDGRLASVGDDGVVHLWNARHERIRTYRPPPPEDLLTDMRSVRFSPDGRWLAWAGVGYVGLADSNLSGPATLLEATPRNTLRCLRFSHDSTRLAAAGNDFTIWMWDVRGRTPLPPLRGHTSVVYGLAWSHDDRLIASCGSDQTVRLWDAAKARWLVTLRDSSEHEPNAYFGLAFSASDDALILAGSAEQAHGYFATWDLRRSEGNIAGNLEFWAGRLRHEGLRARAEHLAWARAASLNQAP